jgi:hypothetical protein
MSKLLPELCCASCYRKTAADLARMPNASVDSDSSSVGAGSMSPQSRKLSSEVFTALARGVCCRVTASAALARPTNYIDTVDEAPGFNSTVTPATECESWEA